MVVKREISAVLRGVEGRIFYDEPMSQHTSLKVGGNADALVFIESEDQLVQVVGKLKAAGIDYLPVGNLTNMIVRDGGYRGVILLMNGLKEMSYRQTPDGGHFISARAGAALARVVGFSAEHELTGLEFCAGIPGSIGGAVWMNAGAFGSEMKDVVTEVTLLDADGQRKVLKREEIVFSYRRTVLPREAIILNSRLKLEKGDRRQIQNKIKEIMQTRQGKHPLEYPSAGSVFKNLPGIPAGRIIEETGLKGKCCGDAEVSLKHANFIVNKGKASATDVLALIGLVTDKVKKEKGIDLETEVIVIGEN
ncbi:MAG: UDP-N-acetylmuramate dehydrogenase [Syntrophaceae bacterium]|nr:UDP-N-acetylmuramate dehydrogenase [Syntrophaceae bacterium]